MLNAGIYRLRRVALQGWSPSSASANVPSSPEQDAFAEPVAHEQVVTRRRTVVGLAARR